MKEIELNEILEGLRANPKRISSKFFYDSRGSELFREITNLAEYYLTRAEEEILRTYGKAIVDRLKFEIQTAYIVEKRDTFGWKNEIVELGVGDGRKTIILFETMGKFLERSRFVPVDISSTELGNLVSMINERFPNLETDPMDTDYFEALKLLSKSRPGVNKLVLFLGSNIGNFNKDESLAFLKALRLCLNRGDFLIIGFDLVKNPETILAAYNDKDGITREFNLNLLKRFNSEFGADFNVDRFLHYPHYDPANQAAKSYLISLEDQDVRFNGSGEIIHFKKYEAVFTEISQKFDSELIIDLARGSGFDILENYHDKNHYFVDSLWHAV